MADTKITALTALTAADPSTDVLPIVDTSDTTMAASGTTKKISINNILGASGTATLASATISGDLTVDTSTLKVDSANNRVGVLTASPINTLHVNGEVTLPINNLQYWNAYYSGGFKSVAAGYAGYTAFATNGDFVLANTDASAAGAASALTFYNRYRISNAGIHTWETVGGVAGTAMTLNSTGLGVGRSPISKLTVDKASQTPGGATPNGAFVITDTAGGNLALELGVNSAGSPYIQSRNSTTAAYYDLVLQPTSGNVGIGVTPSAWSSSYKAIQIGTVGSLSSGSSGTFGASFASNMYQAAGGTTYIANGYASRYDVRTDTGNHVWYISSNNTLGANQPLSFNTAMTLESTGSLVLGDAAVATTATNGFLYIPGCAGTPTGTPTAKTGRVPLVVDTTNNKLYFYSGGAWVAAN